MILVTEDDTVIPADVAILALGHSARDTFMMLHRHQLPMDTAFLLQLSKAFFFQQCAVIDNSNIVSQQGNLRKNMTGNQNSFSSGVAKLPNKGAYLRNADGIETVDRLIQNQKFRIVHNSKGDGKPLLHTKRILGKELFIFVGQSYQIQSVFDGMIVWYAPQSSKDTQVLCAGQIGIKAGGLN